MGSSPSKKKVVHQQSQVSSPFRYRSPSPDIPPERLFPPSTFSDQPTNNNFYKEKNKTHGQLTSYATIWDRNGKLSSTFVDPSLSKEEARLTLVHNQEETAKNELTSEHSSTYQNAQVRSVLISEVTSEHQLTTSEQLDLLIDKFKQSNTEFDQSVQQRIELITQQAENILGQIIKETEINQQELLRRAKEEQINEDRTYRATLESFLKELDQKRAMQLAKSQAELVREREKIFEESQLKLRSLAEQANSLKTQIMSQEENKASQHIEQIINQINTLNKDTQLQLLGSTTTTNIQLNIQQSVGTNQHNININRDKQQTLIKRTIISEQPNLSANQPDSNNKNKR